MDQHTWNAYHLVSNRARAVCYSTRQQQFHAKTEMTINKLVWSSDQQARAMSEFERSQLRVSENQEELMAQQEKLKSSQQNVQVFVAENLKELTIEKALIAAGQRELARMTDSIRKKLDAASNIMLTNEQQRQISHRQLVQDLSTVQEYAKFLQEKLDIGAKDLHSHHKETSMQFEDTLNNLSKINASIGYLQKMVEETRVELGDKLGWVVRYLHGSGDPPGLARILSVVELGPRGFASTLRTLTRSVCYCGYKLDGAKLLGQFTTQGCLHHLLHN
ncbi:hypothetical protein HPB47_016684 [Ixodes persulcatus]|uniref:Uncharacterized protein n=1 Tax=Ixodes persulcatus TaxID=34615 RepID=A0AC60QTY7_IXOPE|nr:hypothetical protein HPB47_016684 [Ixodes persulcatus]